MPLLKRLLVLLALFALTAPLAAIPEPTADELRSNRRRFEQLRKHPEVVAKLRADAEAFFALPIERKRQIVQIHKELHQEPPATQVRLTGVLERYVDWLDDLDKEARKQLAEAKDKNARLALIKVLREQEWIKDQPKAVRDRLAGLQGQQRQQLIALEKSAERQRRLEWLIAARFWSSLDGDSKFRRPLPTKFADLPLSVQAYFQNYLHKMFLTPEEREQLKSLEGQWPQFPMKLVEIADRHPAALPGSVGPRSLAELPARILRELTNKLPNPKKVSKEVFEKQPALLAKILKLPDSEWPKFGADLARAAKAHNIVFEYEFLAYDFDCLNKAMKDFMKDKLEPVLDAKETYRLAKAIGKWPDYPQTIQDIANNHHLHAPWFILPPVEDWDKYRLHKAPDR